MHKNFLAYLLRVSVVELSSAGLLRRLLAGITRVAFIRPAALMIVGHGYGCFTPKTG